MIQTEKTDCDLLSNLEKIHTTEMGAGRIRKNLLLDSGVSDVVDFCKKKIASAECRIYRQGKNWYCEVGGMKITVNACSYTIITAHRM